MFLKNKYHKLYYKIIDNAKNKTFSGYVEKHHIIPISLNGKNIKSNTVELTAREHYLCHYLLCKFTTGVFYFKMLHAFHFLNIANPRGNGLRYINSRLYKKLKEERSKCLSLRKGKVFLSEESKLKIKNSNYHKNLFGEKNPFYGKKHTEKVKQKLSELAKKRSPRKYDLKSRKKISESKLGSKNPAARPVEINGIKYETILQASISLNIHRDTCRWRIANNSIKWKNWKYLRK